MKIFKILIIFIFAFIFFIKNVYAECFCPCFAPFACVDTCGNLCGLPSIPFEPCFFPGTQVATPGGEKKIESLKLGESVVAYDVLQKKETTSVVKEILKVTASAYYKLKLKDSSEIQVTGDHPLYSIQKSENLTFWEYLKTESLSKKAISLLF